MPATLKGLGLKPEAILIFHAPDSERISGIYGAATRRVSGLLVRCAHLTGTPVVCAATDRPVVRRRQVRTIVAGGTGS